MTSDYPNIFVIGAPKAGTTSLFEILASHPEIFAPPKKELHYFTSTDLDQSTNGPGDRDAVSRIIRNKQDYLAQFSGRSKHQSLAIDVSPSYLYYDAAALRIAAVVPGARAIALLRDPVERAYSQYLHLRRAQREDLDFVAALDAEDGRRADGWAAMWRYSDTGRYTSHLRHYTSTFGAENVLVVHSELLRARPAEQVARIFSFLGVSPPTEFPHAERNRSGEARWSYLARLQHRSSATRRAVGRLLPQSLRTRVALRLVELNTGTKPSMSPVAARRLREALADEARELADFLGSPPPWSWTGSQNVQSSD